MRVAFVFVALLVAASSAVASVTCMRDTYGNRVCYDERGRIVLKCYHNNYGQEVCQ